MTDRSDAPPAPAPQTPGRPKRRRLLIAAIVILAVLAALVVFAPSILSLGFIRQAILGRATADMPARIAVEGWSLSWFGSQEVRGLEVQTADGRPAAKADRIVLEQGLLELLQDRSRIGAIRIDEAEVWTDGAAKLRDAFAAEEAKAPKPPEAERPSRLPTLPQAVRIGSITAHSKAGTLRLTQAVFENAPDDPARQRFKAAWEVESGAKRGSGKADGTLEGLRTDWRGWDALGVTATVRCDTLHLAPLWGIAADMGVEMDGGGTLTSVDVTASQSRSGEYTIRATCDGQGVWVTGKALSGDRPALESLHLVVAAAYDGKTCRVQEFELKTPAVAADATGTFAAISLGAEPPAGNATAHLTVDLAALARMLPKTLKIPEGVSVEAGFAKATLDTFVHAKAVSLDMTADIKGVRGERNGKKIVLEPMNMALNVSRERQALSSKAAAGEDWTAALQGLQVNDLTVSGPFGLVKASGRMEAFALDAKLDLTKSTEEVGQFIDLGGWAARGKIAARIETKGDFASGISLGASAAFAGLAVDLGPGHTWTEPQGTLTASGALAFDGQRHLTTAQLASLDLTSTTATVAAKGQYTQAESQWKVSGSAAADGDIARALSLADLILQVTATAPAAKEEPGADMREYLKKVAVPASALGGSAAAGWHVDATVEGASDKGIAAGGNLRLTNFTVAVGPKESPPVRVQGLAVSGQAGRKADLSWDIQVTSCRLTSPDVALAATGSASLPKDFNLAELGASLTADADANLDALGATLRSLDLLPKEPLISGAAKVHIVAQAEPKGPVSGNLTMAGADFRLAWPADKREVSEARPTLAATLSAARDEKGMPASIQVSQWRLVAGAGTLDGAAAFAKTPNGWTYNVEGRGGGDLKPLAATVASAMGSKPAPIEGRWQIAAKFSSAAESKSLELAAAGTNLVIPAGGADSKPQPLPDASIKTVCSFGKTGDIAVKSADVSIPGLTAAASGTVRLPSDTDKNVAADGKVAARANLAELAEVLRPFGILAAESKMTGAADLSCDAATTADGTKAKGTLNLSGIKVHLAQSGIDVTAEEAAVPVSVAYATGAKQWTATATGNLSGLDLQLAESGINIKETKATVPVSVVYAAAAKQWTVTATGIQSELATGSASAVIVQAQRQTQLRAECDLTTAGERIQKFLGTKKPKDLALSGPWRVTARVAGALPDEGAWNQRIAGLAGSGTVGVGGVRYDKVTGGNGTVPWQLAEGQLFLSPNPAAPARLKLIDGTLAPAGRIDLRGKTARLIIDQPQKIIEGVRMDGQELQGYLKYSSPLFGANVASGRFSLVIEAMDIPLSAEIEKSGTARGYYQIDNFQTTLTGPLAWLIGLGGGQGKAPGRISLVHLFDGKFDTPLQQFGPVAVRLKDGVLTISKHSLLFQQNQKMELSGTIWLDGRMDFVVSVPLTSAFLTPFGANKTVMAYVEGQKITVPMTGTVDSPHIDQAAFNKRVGEMLLKAAGQGAVKELGDILKGMIEKKKK